MDYRLCIFNIQRLLLLSVFSSCCIARDLIELDVPVKKNGVTLVSAGNGTFELGFFNPNGDSSGKRYVGIWHTSSPQSVVWVANREKPVPSTSHGVFRINKGNLQVWDESKEEVLWSTNIKTSQANLTAKLMDSGNLVLGDSVWESFKNPTDTFLPGMKMQTDLKLTSWKAIDDPAPGTFSFKIDDQEQYVIMNGSVPYWKNGGKFPSSNRIPDVIADMLSNFSKLQKIRIPRRDYSGERPVVMFNGSIPRRDYSGQRLVLMFNGSITYEDLGKDSLDSIWSEPENECSVDKACGDFGSCNAHSTQWCKCLPGFKPTYPSRWDSGDFSSGCRRIGVEPKKGDTFLNLTSMTVEKPGLPEHQVSNETECRKECLDNPHCTAYSFQAAKERVVSRDNSSFHNSTCSIWDEALRDLQENFIDGRNLSIRVAIADLGSTDNCKPCGTNTIPYPLSTGPDCGDLIYFSFTCNSPADIVTFRDLDKDYKVVSIDPDKRKFVVQVNDTFHNCKARGFRYQVLQLGRLSPFSVTDWCYTRPWGSSFQVRALSQKTLEVEIQWDPPPEPRCRSESHCDEWPNTSCGLGKNKCLCNKGYHWNDLGLNCTQSQEVEDHQPSEALPRVKSRAFPFVIVFTSSTVVSLLVGTICFIIWRRRNMKKKEKKRSDQRSKDLLKLDTQKRIKHYMNSGEFEEDNEEGIDVPFFDFDAIIAATDGFSDYNKLGQGGYGPVYKGTFQGGQEIAVKRLSSVSGQGLEEFKNEVVLIAKLQHRNLVRLRGYCIKGGEKILLYEYMPNRSLDSFIFDQEQSKMLDWEKRFNIILGVARGLLYLHQDSRLRIIHRDLKTSNILLDREMEPKISDFGLARIFGGKQTEANTERVVGTYGYMSPEYALEGLFSVKSDVFSFGVVLLEIISGKRNTRLVQLPGRPLSLLSCAWRLWTENNVSELVDPAMTENCNSEQFLKCVKIALLCVQEDPTERPTMSTVVTMLDSDSANVPDPLQSAFVLKTGATIASTSSASDTRAEITVTLEQGR